MDKIISITLGIFIVILFAFTGIITYTTYTETMYRNTIAGTYYYTCNITTDSSLYNVTLFIPVPDDSSGNSPVVSAFSSHLVMGVPAGWETTLYDTGKATLVKVTTPAIVPPQGTSASNPYTITLSSTTSSHTPVNTRDPVGNSAVFRPVQALRETGCPEGSAYGSSCFTYTTSIFADYTTSPGAVVIVTSAVTGKNTWKIFGPRSNEYHTEIGVVLKGDNHGWVVPDGLLASGIGTYDAPAGS